MAIERRDIELAIRAKDQGATATFGRTRQAVEGLTTAIEKQAAGVRSGETALDDLRNTYRELEVAAKSLGQQQGLIDSLRRQTDALTKFEQKATAAREKADAYGQTLSQQATVSVRAEQRLAVLNRTADRAAATFEKQKDRVAATSAALEAAGHDTNDLDGASKSLLRTSQQVGAAFTTLNTVMSGYAREVKAGQAADKEAAAAQQATLTRRQEALKAFNDQIKEQSRLRAAVLAAETSAARAANEEAKAVEKQTAAYREQATEIDRLLTSRGRLSGANVGLAREQGRGSAEASVRAVSQPGSGVTNLRTLLTTAEAQAQEVQNSLGKPVSNFLGLTQDLERSLANVQRIARQVDGYQAQRAAVQATGASYREARDRLRTLNEEFKRNPTAANAAAVRGAVPAYERARAAFVEQYQALRVLREGLRNASVDATKLGEVERQLVGITDRLSQSVRNLRTNYDRFGGTAREGAAGFLGLRPYELQNLSFQINDFFTQLASGTSATQAFAQQIGQVAQIQPIWTRLVALAPAFISLAAAIGTVTAALSRLYQTEASSRNFTANIMLLTGQGSAGGNAAEGVRALGAEITALARRLEELGFDFDEARKSALAFLRQGITPETLSGSVEAAARLSRVLGVDLAEATRLVARAMQGGRDGILALAEAGGGLSQEQREALLRATELSDAYERQRAVLAILLPAYQAADREGLSPFREVVIGLRNAWHSFLDTLGNLAPIRALKDAIDAIPAGLRTMQTVGQTVARALVAAFAPVLLLFDGISRALRFLGGQVGEVRDQGPPIDVDPATGEPRRPAAAGPNRRAPLGGQTVGQARAQQALEQQQDEFLRDDRNQTVGRRVQAARDAAERRFREQFAEATAEQIRDIGNIAEIEIRRKIQEEGERAGRSAAAEVRRDLAAINGDLQNTLRIRDEAIRGIQEDVAAGALTPAQAIQRIAEEADKAKPAIERLRDEAQRFLDSGRGRDVVRDSAIERVIAQANRQLSGAGGGGAAARTGANAVLQTQQQEIQRQLQERANFIQTQNALEQQGLVTREEAERRIVAMYGETRDALVANIEAYRQASAAAAENGQITQAAASGNAAQVELWNAQLERINPQWARMKQGFENVVGSAAMTAFDSIAQALGNLAAGVIDVADAWDAAGQAALQFVADVLKGIAQVILQEQILQAVRIISKSISAGLAHSGAVVGQPGGQRRSVNPAVFANAPRMHGGGVVGGLRADERAAILQTGEEVLTRDDPRNVLNAGKSGNPVGASSGDQAIRNILVIGDDQIADAMSGSAGDKVLISFLQRNAPTVRSLLRGT